MRLYLCASGIGFGSFPKANQKPIWPHYDVSHSRVIAFKTKRICWKGKERIPNKKKVYFLLQGAQQLQSCDDDDDTGERSGGCCTVEDCLILYMWKKCFHFLFDTRRMWFLGKCTCVCVCWGGSAAQLNISKCENWKEEEESLFCFQSTVPLPFPCVSHTPHSPGV